MTSQNIDNKSLTKANNNEFFFTKLSPGIIINGVHAIEIARKAGIEVKYLIEEYNFILA